MDVWDIIENIKTFFLKIFYHTLTEENLEKIIKSKEEDLENIETLEEIELQKIKEDLYKELSEYHTDEEIEKLYQEMINDVKKEEK